MPVSSRAPHYVRVARALALLTGLAGLPACSDRADPTPPGDSGVDADVLADAGGDAGPTTDAGGDTDAGPTTDAGGDVDAGPTADAGGDVDAGPMADAGVENDAGGDRCATCVCSFMAPGVDAGTASCESLGYFECCPAVGPLFPPDLPV
jgi:hypothetical protein